MLTYDIERAKQAVQLLVDSSYFKQHVRRLRNSMVKKVVPFSGETEVLNELVRIGRQSGTALENLISVAEDKRSVRGSYMRQFMQSKRQRDRKVIMVEEARQRRHLTLDERLAVLRATHERWNVEKEQHKTMCARQYAQQVGVTPGWIQVNAFIRDFWMHKDVELDVQLGQAKEHPAERRIARRRDTDGVGLCGGRRGTDRTHCMKS